MSKNAKKCHIYDRKYFNPVKLNEEQRKYFEIEAEPDNKSGQFFNPKHGALKKICDHFFAFLSTLPSTQTIKVIDLTFFNKLALKKLGYEHAFKPYTYSLRPFSIHTSIHRFRPPSLYRVKTYLQLYSFPLFSRNLIFNTMILTIFFLQCHHHPQINKVIKSLKMRICKYL